MHENERKETEVTILNWPEVENPALGGDPWCTMSDAWDDGAETMGKAVAEAIKCRLEELDPAIEVKSGGAAALLYRELCMLLGVE